jgi:hypothetical protein
MKNNQDFARLDQEFYEFLCKVRSDFSQFKENFKIEYQEDQQEPGESPVKIGIRVIQLIEECMEEQRYWIIGEAFNKGVEFVQKHDNFDSNSFWDIIEDSMGKDLEDLAEEEYQQLLG